MPYRLSKSGLCVERADTGKVMKCYDNHHEAVAYLDALVINVKKARYNILMKSLVTKGGPPSTKPGAKGTGSGGARTGAGRKKKIGITTEQISRFTPDEEDVIHRNVNDTQSEQYPSTLHRDDEIRKFEDSVIKEDVEHALVIDSDGTVLVNKASTQDDINRYGAYRITPQQGLSFSPEETARWDAALKAGKAITMSHNHPSGFSFSVEDMKMGVSFGAKTIRAVGMRNDKKQVYTLTFPESIKNVPFGNVVSYGRTVYDQLRKKYAKLVLGREVSSDDAWFRMVDERVQAISDFFGMKYTHETH